MVQCPSGKRTSHLRDRLLSGPLSPRGEGSTLSRPLPGWGREAGKGKAWTEETGPKSTRCWGGTQKANGCTEIEIKVLSSSKYSGGTSRPIALKMGPGKERALYWEMRPQKEPAFSSCSTHRMGLASAKESHAVLFCLTEQALWEAARAAWACGKAYPPGLLRGGADRGMS